jgi:hypothetical protein
MPPHYCRLHLVLVDSCSGNRVKSYTQATNLVNQTFVVEGRDSVIKFGTLSRLLKNRCIMKLLDAQEPSNF